MINSTTDTGLIVKLTPLELAMGDNDRKDFHLKFEFDELYISPYGIAASPLQINAFDYSGVRPHRIMISQTAVLLRNLFLIKLKAISNPVMVLILDLCGFCRLAWQRL